MMPPAKLKELIEDGHSPNVLILDLRVSPQYAQSRVKGALNLCIPTTLLKRATFNLEKLQQTFQASGDQERFSRWRTAGYLVVYDGFSFEKRDAVSALNMIKKFTDAGYSGSANILRGGFNAFAAAYPDLVDKTTAGMSPGLSLDGRSAPNGTQNSILPVLGGVLLPTTGNTPNAFFSNIRQNQDLVDGVGQMDIGVPAGLDEKRLPRWLKEATESRDHGKKVSDEFLRIELIEQSRMRNAYAVPNGPATNKASGGGDKVQLSGIEKGTKNRYKDILPFEHARVRLQGRPEGACDYVNASHIRANRSHKRYIASQGPLPATFEVRVYSNHGGASCIIC
jgi:rhodanese-related sulfurtransferase